MQRPTISDIARQAGVTKAAVSFALNGRPGVSAATRERIIAIAAELGFQPSSAARALTAGQAGAFGLVLGRPAGRPDPAPAWLPLISGIEADLAGHRATLLFTLADDFAAESELHRQWWAQRRVDGVFVVDAWAGDPRLPVLGGLGLPAVVVGSRPRPAPGLASPGLLPAVVPDGPSAARLLAGHLADEGHRRVAHVSGRPGALRSVSRREAFTRAGAAAGLAVQAVTAPAGPGLTQPGGQATAELLGAAAPPTAIVYDSDVLAAAGLAAAHRLGVSVPGAVSLLSWDDSPLCELAYPALTALRWDEAAAGTAAARLLRLTAAGARPGDVTAAPPSLQRRASSGPVAA